MVSYSRTGSGPPLLLVHGVGHYSGGWDPVLPLLAGTRDVIAVDLPGFGRSSSLAGDQTPAALTDAVAGLLDELGLDRVHVAGNSLGGGIALELGRRDRALSVTALSPIGFWSPREYEWARRILNGTYRGARRTAPVARLLSATAVARTLIGGHLTARPWRISPEAALAASQALADSDFERTMDVMYGWRAPRPNELDCPVTIAWGTRDRILIPRQAARARRLYPDARHVGLPGCGHVPMSDDAALVATALLEGSGR